MFKNKFLTAAESFQLAPQVYTTTVAFAVFRLLVLPFRSRFSKTKHQTDLAVLLQAALGGTVRAHDPLHHMYDLFHQKGPI